MNAVSKSYSERSISLRKLGFDNYKSYILSPLWKTIRSRVLCRDGHLCRICKRNATNVHHNSYSEQALAGYDDLCLVSLCANCHMDFEFTELGNKCHFDYAVAKCTSKIKRLEILE